MLFFHCWTSIRKVLHIEGSSRKRSQSSRFPHIPSPASTSISLLLLHGVKPSGSPSADSGHLVSIPTQSQTGSFPFPEGLYEAPHPFKMHLTRDGVHDDVLMNNATMVHDRLDVLSCSRLPVVRTAQDAGLRHWDRDVSLWTFRLGAVSKCLSTDSAFSGP